MTTPPPALRIRRAAAGDIAAIVGLVENAYRGEAGRAGWTTEADLLDGQRTDAAEVAALIAGDDSAILVAERDRDPAPAGSVLWRLEPAGGYLGMLAVRPTLQRSGVGSALIAAAEDAARDAGRATMRMTVLAQRPELIAWYGRHGYAATGERVPFPYHQPRCGLPRRPDLVLVVLRKPL